MPVIYSVDRRKRSSGFEWCVLRNQEVVTVTATYEQACQIARISNANQLDIERMAMLDAATIGEGLRPHAAQAVRARRYAA
jgi:hypothetical protein